MYVIVFHSFNLPFNFRQTTCKNGKDGRHTNWSGHECTHRFQACVSPKKKLMQNQTLTGTDTITITNSSPL